MNLKSELNVMEKHTQTQNNGIIKRDNKLTICKAICNHIAFTGGKQSEHSSLTGEHANNLTTRRLN